MCLLLIAKCVPAMCIHDGSNKRYELRIHDIRDHCYTQSKLNGAVSKTAHNFAVPARLGRPYTKIYLSFGKSGRKSEHIFVHLSNC